ncbi:MAG: YheC/YheD family protein [Cyanobacteria bacterium J06607_13]
MKLLSICDPTRYDRPPLDVPTFYQHLARDSRVTLYHMPAPQVLNTALPTVEVFPAAGELTYGDFVTLGEGTPVRASLAEMDVVFCRTLKPFSDGYLDALTRWESLTRFVNRPSGKQVQMRSDFLPAVARDYMPETVVTNDCRVAIEFFEAHQTIVAKRANSCGGRGVFKIWYEGGVYCVDNVLTGVGTFAQFSDVMRFLRLGQQAPIQFCRFLARTDQGDKRVVVVDGEIYGSYIRRSKSGHWVNNVSRDGLCQLAPIGDDERAAIAHTVHHYQSLGLHTLGYDFLMDNDGTWRISEINAGNIGGFARLELLTGEPVMDRLLDWLFDYAQRSPSEGLLSEVGTVLPEKTLSVA